MANVCQEMVDKKRFEAEQTNMFCLRAMTGSIILFDHLHPQGAFHKKSPIHVTLLSPKKFMSPLPKIGILCCVCLCACVYLWQYMESKWGGCAHAAGADCTQIKGCITVLKNFTGGQTDGLLNALKFTTIHLNDPETPNNIKHLLE